MNAAILEFRDDLRLEHDVPAVDLRVRAEHLAHFAYVVTNADRAPHVVDGVLVARVVHREALGDLVPCGRQIRELALVELLEHASLDLPLEEVGGRNYEIVSAAACEQLCLEQLV